MKSQQGSIYLSVSSITIFFLTTLLRNSFVSLDSSINAWVPTVQIPSMTFVAILVSEIFEAYVLLIITGTLSAYLFTKNKKKESVLLMSTMIGVAATTELIKHIVQAERPLNGLIESTGYAYPSGHSTASLVFFGMILYVFWGQIGSNKNKILLTLLSVLVVLIVGFDRIYLNTHWLSDVIGGYLLGTFLLSSAISISQNYGKIEKVVNKI